MQEATESSQTTDDNSDSESELKIALISLHGLIRYDDMELGRDADTGGQVKYVVELAEALSKHPNVAKVELLTRQIMDPRYDPSYAKVEESINDKATIIRIPFGPRRYLKKESLWPYLEEFVDQALHHFRRSGYLPDIIHAHYADAGYGGAQLANLLGIPMLFTGHSLGRVKKERLLAGGTPVEKLEERYRIATRIEAEEQALDTASMVVTSTVQEVEEQYSLYERYQPDRMEVIAPGVDLQNFIDKSRVEYREGGVIDRIRSFLHEPEKPAILAIARADHRKNLVSLVKAYGENEKLKEMANLVIIAGNRDDILNAESSKKRVIAELLMHIDQYDLYGKIAYPKTHQPDEIPQVYRWAAESRGVFVNPAFTEPFGLTLLEAAAVGLPVVATNDGGPRDILAACQNGELVDPLDTDLIGEAIERVLADPERWEQLSNSGKVGVEKTYSWSVHVEKYVRDLHDVFAGRRVDRYDPAVIVNKLPKVDRILITDIDNTLTGDDEALEAFKQRLNEFPENVGFGIATGRNFDETRELLRDKGLSNPDLMVCSVGTEIYYGEKLIHDRSWSKRIDFEWRPDKIREVLDSIEGIRLQPEHCQSQYKVSFTLDENLAPKLGSIRRILRENGCRAKLVVSLGAFMDVIPIRAGDGVAIRHLAFRWGLSPEKLLIVGDSGNDEEMLKGQTLGVVVANHSSELNKLKGHGRILFAKGAHAWAILEGIDYYHFLGDIVIPNDSASA
ncbi:MAG: HAD-IIB family hydrolase [Puniceicoccaceae bacterium]